MDKVLDKGAEILLKLSNNILVIDRDSYQIRACNQTFADMLGYNQKTDLTGKYIQDLSPVNQLGEIQSDRQASQLFKATRKKQANTFYWVFLHSAGTEIFCQLTLSDIKTQNVFICIVQDLSELIKSEEALKTSQAYLLSIINNSEDLIWCIDRNLKLLETNLATKQIYRQFYNTELVKGMDPVSVFTPELKKIWIERYHRVLAGEKFTITDDYSGIKGNLVLETTLSPIIIDNQTIGISCFSRNITNERINEAVIRKTNERLQIYKQLSQYQATNLQDFYDFLLLLTLKFSESETAFLLLNNRDDGTFTLLCKSTELKKDLELMGIEKRYSPSELGFISDILHLRRPLIVNKPQNISINSIHISLYKLINNMTRGVFIPIFEYGKLVCISCFLNKAGDYTSQDLSNLSYVLDSAWQLVRSIEYKYDLYIAKENAEVLNRELKNEVEARKKIELELEVARNKAESSNLAKSTFLANMSHEIRTPMNAIIGFTEILNEKVKEPELKSYTESIRNSGKSLLTLINDVLDLSKVEAGKLELINTFVDIISLFQEIEAVFSLRLKEKGLNFKLTIQPDFPSSIFLDEIRLRQILINLVGNAVKFTNSGSIELKARHDKIESTYEQSATTLHSTIYIEVADTGIGISNEFRSQLFSSFAQQDSSKFTGTGLGLSICKKLIELMDGEINVESEEGVGTTFIISFKNTLVSCDKPDKNPEIRLNPQSIKFKTCQLLLVEDNEENEKYFKSALGKETIEIHTAKNGKEALLILKKIKPGIIITDLKMPVMDGFQLVDKLKSNSDYKDIPVIASTAAIMDREKSEISSHKFDGVLIKPFNVTDLYLVLASWLKYEITGDLSADMNMEKSVQENKKIINLNELIAELSDTGESKWKQFVEHQPLSEVKTFANYILELGEKHESHLLKEYGTGLLNAVNTFDVDAILKNIKNFPNLIKLIKELNE